MRDKLIEFLEKELNFEIDFSKFLEKPKLEEQGDFSFPCFILSKKLQKNPQQISKDLEEKLIKSLPNFLEKVKSVGPFLNFYLNNQIESKQVLENIFNGNFSKIDILKNQKILIEYPSPNVNKALHIGHVRNILLGNSLIKILKKAGAKTTHINMNNDRGIAVCKSMLGYELFYKNESPKSLNLKSDEFISACYIKFTSEAKKNSQLDIDAQKMLVLWEKKDKKTIEIWEKILKFVYEGYKETYKNYKLPKVDKIYFESKIYNKGKDLVLNALKNKIEGFGKENDGAIYCDLDDINLGKKYLLRGDSTTLYMTQDLYLASIKEKEFKPNKSIFIVAKEQNYHFKVLFELLERMKITKTSNQYHFAYGMVYNKDGKAFSSRKGNTISADEVLELVVENSKKNLLEKEKTFDLPKKEIERRSKIIGFCALCFTFLKANPLDDIKFDLEKSLSMNGDTGPYVQYTYARIQSVLKKANYKQSKNLNDMDFSILGEKEISLIKILKTYKETLIDTTNKYKISNIANFLIKLCKAYNDFYQNCNILNEEENIKNSRLILSKATGIVIEDALELLNIEVLDEM